MKLKLKHKLDKKLYNLKMLINAGFTFDEACFYSNFTPSEALKNKCKLELQQQKENAESSLDISIEVVGDED
jgi:hypothetical protein